jgi:hypothetical protein
MWKLTSLFAQSPAAVLQVDWLPDGACLELLRQRRDTGLVLPRLDSIEMRMEKMVRPRAVLASCFKPF